MPLFCRALALTPRGWESGSAESDEEEPTPPECEALDEADERGRTAEASSNRFTRETTEFSNSGSFYADPTLAEAAFEARMSNDAKGCLEAAATKGALQISAGCDGGE